MTTKILIYVCGALLLATLTASGIASCEHKRAEQLEIDLSAANAANSSNLVTIGTQAKAIKQWQALHKTPEEIAVILANGKAYVDEIGRLEKQVRLYRDRDNSLPECVKLLQVAYATCPGRLAVLHEFARGSHRDRGSAGSGREAFTR